MVIVGIISAGLVALAMLFILIRLVVDWRLTVIQKESDHSSVFRRKLNHLKKIEQARHIRYLLLICLMIGIGLAITIGSFLILAEDQKKMTLQNQKVNERIMQLEVQQKHLFKSIPLKNYPEEGIGLSDCEWNKLTAKEKDLKLQEQMETVISQKSIPYFGSFDTKVSLSEPKILTLQLKCWTEDDASKETVKKNLDAFAKEVEKISEMTDIHVRMFTSVGDENQVIYSVNYSRKSDAGEFYKQNVSEKKLKNVGEKG